MSLQCRSLQLLCEQALSKRQGCSCGTHISAAPRRPPGLLRTLGMSDGWWSRPELRAPAVAAAVLGCAAPGACPLVTLRCRFQLLCGGEARTCGAVSEQRAKNNHFALALLLG